MPPKVIENASALPGAFLFMRITTPPEDNATPKAPARSMAVVAYDPDITKATKLKEIQAKYNTGKISSFPYNERFGVNPEGTSVWDSTEINTYGMLLPVRATRSLFFVQSTIS